MCTGQVGIGYMFIMIVVMGGGILNYGTGSHELLLPWYRVRVCYHMHWVLGGYDRWLAGASLLVLYWYYSGRQGTGRGSGRC